MRYDQIIKAIQSKYVGTAEEHEMLAKLSSDFKGYATEADKEHREALTAEMEIVKQQERTLDALGEGLRIDVAVYYWLAQSEDDRSADWGAEAIIAAMRGRGLHPNDLTRLAGLWVAQTEKHEAADAEGE